jgi:predicted Holliday junction resolvase-like endonuclease
MIEWIIGIIIAIIIGYFIGKYLTSKEKFGDKEAVLNAQWEKKIANLEKDYGIKLEQGKSSLEKIKEENKTNLEKLAKEWQVKYLQDMEDLEKSFKNSEKIIKAKSVSSSRRSLVGKFIEKFVPFLKMLDYEASDMHFLGQPVDYIIFDGLHKDEIEKVVFVEVKTGDSKLTKREKSLKDTIEKRRVEWKEINIDTASKDTPDKEMENESTSISGVYNDLNEKISHVRDKLTFKKNSAEDMESFLEKLRRDRDK